MTTFRALHGRARQEAGVTLIELMVTMVLLGVVSALVVAGVQQATRVLTHTDDENRGLQDAKIILDRLSRDIRQARGVVCDGAGGDTYCREHLQLWIDENSDYIEDPEEIITWNLQDNPDGEHYDVWRVKGVLPGHADAAATGFGADREDAVLLRRRGQHGPQSRSSRQPQDGVRRDRGSWRQHQGGRGLRSP